MSSSDLPIEEGDVPFNGDPKPARVRIARISKACEPCRIRKSRCDIATKAICSECEKRHMSHECILRSKARPNRPLPKQQEKKRLKSFGDVWNIGEDSGSLEYAGEASGSSRLEYSINAVERVLGTLIRQKLAVSYPLHLNDEQLTPATGAHSSFDTTGIAGPPPIAVSQAVQWIDNYLSTSSHEPSYINETRLRDVVERVFNLSLASGDLEDLKHDELAFTYVALALGGLRQRGVDPENLFFSEAATSTKTHRLWLQSDSGPAKSCMMLFVSALLEIDQITQPTGLAVHAFYLMFRFMVSTTMGHSTYDMLNRAIDMLEHLLKEATTKEEKLQHHSLCLLLYIADVSLASLNESVPMFQTKSIDVSEVLQYTNDYPLSSDSLAHVTLIRTASSLLANRASLASTGPLSDDDLVQSVLRTDAKLDRLRSMIAISETPGNGSISEQEKGQLLRLFGFHWYRIVLRVPYLSHQSLGHSSLAISCRSAVALLDLYATLHPFIAHKESWINLARVNIILQIILIACMSGEIRANEVERSISTGLKWLEDLQAYWANADVVKVRVTYLSRRLGIPVVASGEDQAALLDADAEQSLGIQAIDTAAGLNGTTQDEELGALAALAAASMAPQDDGRVAVENSGSGLPILAELTIQASPRW